MYGQFEIICYLSMMLLGVNMDRWLVPRFIYGCVQKLANTYMRYHNKLRFKLKKMKYSHLEFNV